MHDGAYLQREEPKHDTVAANAVKKCLKQPVSAPGGGFAKGAKHVKAMILRWSQVWGEGVNWVPPQ
jgi:hypothetical protein